jgi:hypothetical protein
MASGRDDLFAYAVVICGVITIAFGLMALGHFLSPQVAVPVSVPQVAVAQSPSEPAKAVETPFWELVIHPPVGDTVPYATYATAQACDDSRAFLITHAINKGHAVPSLSCKSTVPPWRLWLKEWFPRAGF